MPREDVLAAARKSPLFSRLKPRALDAVLRRGALSRHEGGESIFMSGDPADRFYLVVRGRVKIFKLSSGGAQQILHGFGPGETFGEAAMWEGGRFPACAEALEPTQLLAVSRAVLREAFGRDPELAIGMLAGLSRRLRELVGLVEELSLKDVPARLAGALLDEAEKAGGSAFCMKRTKAELAAAIGTIPETLSRALRKLKRAGWIEVRGPRIAVFRPDELRRLSGRD
ncbi:MAG: Crp/Fnr family transcriptional regulator [Elusimicrobia bacterium]|nr:Crp/Fnr family transcriptional regulator [Elusimicrobiota bacterium]